MISQVLLYLGGTDVTDFPVSYSLGLSADDTTYTTVATGSGSEPTTPICFTRQSARYVKITQTGTSPMNWWAIYEIAIVP